MDKIDIFILIGIIVASALGALVTLWYNRQKLKEETETLDAKERAAKAEEEYWKSKK